MRKRNVTTMVTVQTAKSSTPIESFSSDLLVGTMHVCCYDSSAETNGSTGLQITLPLRAGYPVAWIRDLRCLIGGSRAPVLGMVSNPDGSVTFQAAWPNGQRLLCLRTKIVVQWMEPSWIHKAITAVIQGMEQDEVR